MPAVMTDIMVVIMGPCGVGKSAAANTVADWVGGSFIEADDYHSAEARARMAAGEALTDDLREPWLERVASAARKAERPTLLACSALKRSYRDRLRIRLGAVVFVHLTAPRAIIASRLAARSDHFVGVKLLDSQLSILEPLGPDEAGTTLDVTAPLRTVCEQALDFMAAYQAANSGLDDDQVELRVIREHMQGR